MKASDAFALMLARHGVSYCFELIGGMLAHLIDSMAEQGKVKIVSMHHEQAAAFAAEGVVRGSQGQSLSVAMGTSGPGATNLMTGISSCWFDSIPCLFITGQVNRSELKDERPIRQQGFQELDVVEMARSVTKYAARVDDEMELLPMMHKAISEAVSGRCGPVLLDIPNDVQRLELPDEHVQLWLDRPLSTVDSAIAVPADKIESLKRLCLQARKPLVCIGGGAISVGCLSIWLDDLRGAGIPHVSTLMGQQFLPDHACNFHMIGTYGNREANWAIQHCDLLIVLGSRLDVRQTGADSADFTRQGKLVQIDVDAGQLNNRVSADLAIHCHLAQFFEAFHIESKTFASMDQGWLLALQQRSLKADRDEYLDWLISPYTILTAMNQTMASRACHYVCDVGNHQMWAAQLIRLGKDQSIHHDGGLGAMGFALPAAIGIALETQQKTIVLCGDGGMQLNIQELDTIWRLNLNLTVVVMNNHSLGMVKNFQDMYFDGRNHSTMLGYSAPLFCDVAAAYKVRSILVKTYPEWDAALKAMAETKEPLLIEVIMPDATECRPRLAFGGKLDEQHPVQ